MFIYVYVYMGNALSHARAGPDHRISVPVLKHVFPSGPSICFRHNGGLQYIRHMQFWLESQGVLDQADADVCYEARDVR